MGESFYRLLEYEKALDYADMAASHATGMMMGERRNELLSQALVLKAQIFYGKIEYSESRIVHEEVYDLLAIEYNPTRPSVLRAAVRLLQELVLLGEYEDAERYSRFCYECHTRPVDTKSDDVSNAALYLYA